MGPASSGTRGHLFLQEELEDQNDTGRKENEPKVLSAARCVLGFSRIEVRLPDGVTATIMRFFEESVARLVTVDADICFHRLRIGRSLSE